MEPGDTRAWESEGHEGLKNRWSGVLTGIMIHMLSGTRGRMSDDKGGSRGAEAQVGARLQTLTASSGIAHKYKDRCCKPYHPFSKIFPW